MKRLSAALLASTTLAAPAYAQQAADSTTPAFGTSGLGIFKFGGSPALGYFPGVNGKPALVPMLPASPTVPGATTVGGTAAASAARIDQLPASVTGLRKGAGAGTADTAATAGTDYATPIAINPANPPYNLKCDGATISANDTALQSLASAAAAGNVKITFPSGICLFSQTVTFTGSNTRLEGNGQGTHLVMRATNSDGIVFSPPSPAASSPYASEASGNSIANIFIQRDNGENASPTAPSAGSALHLIKQTDFKAQTVDLREFSTSLRIEGGVGARFALLRCQQGATWPTGSTNPNGYLVHVQPYTTTSNGTENAVSVSLDNPECDGIVPATNSTVPQVAFGFYLGGVDTFQVNGGHFGLTQSDFVIAPDRSNVGVQSVMVRSYIDGSGIGATGVLIPTYASGQSGNYIEEVIFAGGFIEHHSSREVDIEEPTANAVFADMNIRNASGDGIFVNAGTNVRVVNTGFKAITGRGLFLNSVISASIGNTFEGTTSCLSYGSTPQRQTRYGNIFYGCSSSNNTTPADAASSGN